MVGMLEKAGAGMINAFYASMRERENAREPDARGNSLDFFMAVHL